MELLVVMGGGGGHEPPLCGEHYYYKDHITHPGQVEISKEPHVATPDTLAHPCHNHKGKNGDHPFVHRL